MKLRLFQCGKIRTKKRLLVAGTGDAEIEVPVPFFLIEHPRGNVLFDTGQPLAAAKATAAGDYVPIMREEDYAPVQLERIGLKASDITHVILSHAHSDHAGGAEAFPDARLYLREEEAGGVGENVCPDRCVFKQGENELFDVFGDGGVQIVFTPGHSPGHQSLLLELEKWGTVMLAADSAYTEEMLNGGAVPGVFQDHVAARRTIEKLRALRRGGARVITGHDPSAWAELKLAPAYYE